ncbi:MAG: hypothetical protein ACFFDQ_14000 [Candidatus Thorarchaeota archaeon]
MQMNTGSKERIIATAKKNIDRVVNLPSLLKIMGLNFDERCIMFGALKDSNLHVWLFNDFQQHLVYISEKEECEFGGYNWQ